MDMRFTIPDPANAEAVELPGFPALVAVIGASQAGGCTAQAAARLAQARPMPAVPVEALATLFDCDGDWRLGASALGGSFHPDVAATLLGKGI